MRLMREIVWRMSKGRMGMLIEIWRSEKTLCVHGEHERMRDELERRMRAQGHEAGLRVLCHP